VTRLEHWRLSRFDARKIYFPFQSVENGTAAENSPIMWVPTNLAQGAMQRRLCSWSGRPGQPRTQHNCHHDTKVKPEAATAVIELLMMDEKTPETCWAVNKRKDNKLENWCIWLVIYLNCFILVKTLTLSGPTSNLVRQYDFPVSLRCRNISYTVFVAFVRPLSEPVRRFSSCSTDFSQQIAQVVLFLFLHVFLF
jgi:hypothetical protein